MATVHGADSVKAAIVNYQRRVKTAFRQVMEDEAVVVTQRGKTEHPFRNVTGRAEAGLQCLALQSNNGKTFTLRFSFGPNVPYDRYLEFAHQGRFATLWPVLRSQFPRTIRRASEAIRDVRTT